MAQWYMQLVFKGDTLLGEGLTDFTLVEGVASSNPSTGSPLHLPPAGGSVGDFAGQAPSTGSGQAPSARVSVNGGERYTTVIVSGYALYGRLRGYYSLGIAHLLVDPVSGKAHYLSEQSALHTEPVVSLTSVQRAAIREWLIGLSSTAWENSTDTFRRSLDAERET